MLLLLRELLVVFIVCPESCHPSSESASVMLPGLLNYTWDQLLLLRPTCTPAPQLPSELLAQRPEWGCRRWMWKRWKRGRVQQRLQRRANRPRLPSILQCPISEDQGWGAQSQSQVSPSTGSNTCSCSLRLCCRRTCPTRLLPWIFSLVRSDRNMTPVCTSTTSGVCSSTRERWSVIPTLNWNV